MTSTNGTTSERNALTSALRVALDDLDDAREHLMDESNDGADGRAITAAHAAVAKAQAALTAFDATHPEVLAAIREAGEPARIDFLRRLRADEGLMPDQAAELAALELKHDGRVSKMWHDMTPAEQAEEQARRDAEMASYKAAEAEHMAAFWATWTPEVTASRRAAWNAGLEARGVVRGKPSPKGLRMDMVQAELERELGFRFADLKRAVAKHDPK